MRFVGALVVAGGVLLGGFVTPVRAQVDSREGIALQNEIYQLRQELRSVQDQVARGGGAARGAPPSPQSQPSAGSDLVVQLLTRVDALDEQVRQLRGRLDETQNQLRRQNDDLNKRLDDLAFAINPQGNIQGTTQGNPQGTPPSTPLGTPLGGPPGNFQGGPTAAPNKPQPPPLPSGAPAALTSPPLPLPPAPSGPRTPETTMQEGNAALARRDYPAAEAAARQVLASRTSPRAYDAQFLLAQALAGERQYPQAAVAYDDVYNRSRTGSHAQDARVGLASALTAINEKKAACDVLSRMAGEFPKLRPDITAAMAATAQRAGCH